MSADDRRFFLITFPFLLPHLHLLFLFSFFFRPSFVASASMPPESGMRRAQLVSKGLGKHFESPLCPHDKSKTQKLVQVAGQSVQHRRLAAQLEKLQSISVDHILASAGENHTDVDISSGFDPTNQDFILNDELQPEMDADHSLEAPRQTSKRCIHPDLAADRLYQNWKLLIPTLIQPYLHYVSQMLGKPLPPPSSPISFCNCTQCSHKPTHILCLFFDRKVSVMLP